MQYIKEKISDQMLLIAPDDPCMYGSRSVQQLARVTARSLVNLVADSLLAASLISDFS